MHLCYRRFLSAKLALAAYSAAVLGLSAASAQAQATPQQSVGPVIPTFAQYFGYSVAVSDDVLVVGAPHRPSTTVPFLTPGGADVFRRDPATGAWVVEASLIDSDLHDADLQRSTGVVGAPGA